MSVKKRIRRQHLRTARPEEAAFVELIAVREAFMMAGIGAGELVPGFLPNRGSKTCCPMIVVSRGEKSFTYRLDQFALEGAQASIEAKWREWVIQFGSEGTFATAAVRAWEKSEFASAEGQKKIIGLIERMLT